MLLSRVDMKIPVATSMKETHFLFFLSTGAIAGHAIAN